MTCNDSKRFWCMIIGNVVAILLSITCLVCSFSSFMGHKSNTKEHAHYEQESSSEQDRSVPSSAMPPVRLPPVRLPPVYPSQGDLSLSHVSAHKRLLPSLNNNPKPDVMAQFSSTNVALLLKSEMDDASVEHALNVGILPSGMQVLHSGMYYVYSSVYFSSRSDQLCRDYALQSWHHNVLRISSNDRQNSDVILRSIHTCCDDCTSDKETSYAGGAFYLEAGDHLSVEISGYALVRFDKQSSYMGLYMLGTPT